ncbi:MAG: DUF2244 domain-containing protein [Roseococcus sp.]
MVKARTLFVARSAPLDSLGPRGFRNLAWLIGALFAATGLLFALMGAWPVMVFVGAEALLVLVLMAAYRSGAARSSECITLTEEAITVLRRQGARVTEARFEPFWVRLVWEEGRLRLVHRGREVEIGLFLGPEEREALAEALGRALHALRHPVFDNPQLRDPG